MRAVSFLAVPEARGSICHVHQLLCANFCSDPANLCSSHLSHYHILAFLNEFPLCLDDGLQELDVLNVPAVRLDAVDEMLHHALVDLAAELEIVHENVLHCHCFQDLREGMEGSRKSENQQATTSPLRGGKANTPVGAGLKGTWLRTQLSTPLLLSQPSFHSTSAS